MFRDNSSERYVLIESLYQQAFDLAPEARADFLSRQCDDESIRSEVAALLRHHDTAGDDFLDQPVSDLARLAESARVPERIGRYLISGTLGEGGMGVVYEASQDNPRRHVAVKVIRPGVSSAQALRRFDHEAAVLGRLQHPGIAHIYEAGVGDVVWAGGATAPQPFFVMELIEGQTLRAHARTAQLDTRQRLHLFASICDAVEHAHQKGVIHRDLKPGNILVTRSGQPKVLDFGVAHVTDADVQVTTIHTRAAQVVGTLAYMSPEQVEGRVDALDTRADVYALGVILYELLAGQLPYNLVDLPIPQAARVITETAPASLAGQNRAFRGDLATIVGKALEKDPARRYGSVAELAGDVRRYLRREPIAARPAKAIYQLRKFAQRHQGLVGGVAATLLVLIAGVVVSVVFAVGQTRALEESQRQRRIAEAVNEFLNKDLLGKADPYGGATHDASLREVLDQAAAAIESRFLDEPLVHASIRSTLGKTYYQLGDYDESARHLEVALATYRAEYGAGGAETIPLWHLLVQTHNFAWRLDDAEALLADFLPAVEDAVGPDHLHTAQAHADYGVLRRRQNRYEEAEHAYLRAIEIYERDPGTKPRTLAITRENLGIVYEKMNRFADAERLMEQAVETFERDSGPDSADVAYGLTNLGHIYRQGRGPPDGLDLAQQCFERAYAIRRERLGENHIETLRTHASIARLHENRGEHAFAEEVQRDVLARRERTLAPDHLDVLTSTSDLAISIENQGRVEEAVDLCRTVLDRGQGHWGPEYPNVNFWRRQLVRLLTKLDDQDGVRAVYEEQRALLERAVAEPDPDVKHVKALSGFLMMCEDESLRDLDRALELAEQAVQMTEGQDPVALDNLARALLRSGREDAALEMQARALAAFEHRAQGAGASASAINEFARALVLCEVEDARDPTKALPVAERAVEASGRRIPHILDTLALVLAENGRLDEAIDTKERVIALIPPGDPTWRARIQATLDELVARRAKAASDPT